MQLIIAEKPSVARDLARVLGVRASGQHCFEGDRRVITWCIGHLVEIDEPGAHDERWRAWRLDTLPILPPELRLRPSRHAVPQLRAVERLLGERRFTSVVNACDAGREGELIFRQIYRHACARLPVQRLWISSLTDEAIRRGFAALQPGTRFDALADAARCRSEADWLVGMNGTRAVTVRGRFAGHEALYSIGRVQTPTLAMLVQREQAIRAFVPRDYWEIRGDFATANGERFSAMWRATAASPAATGRAPTAPAPGRLASAALADELVARDAAQGAADDVHGPRVERVQSRVSREPPPQLFDLTSLQRTANRRFGFSAQRTLELAQALYERHKVLTYPRTDSRHLSSDMVGELPQVIAALGGTPEYARFADHLAAHPPRPNRRIVDDAKVSDHHAIIPTSTPVRPGALDRDEARLFDLVARRFLGAFYPDAEFALTEAWIRVGAPDAAATRRAATATAASTPRDDEDDRLLEALPPPPDRYLARGRVRLVAGWQEVAGIDEGRRPPRPDARPDGRGDAAAGDDDELRALLPPLVEGQPLEGAFVPMAKQTRPPPRYTEATLLGAMESAGKSIDDEALRAAMRDCGLGTPATRASIIETLLERTYIERERQQLVPTVLGMQLIESLPVPSLASPELTGAWEARLARIARGEESRASFMADIAHYVTDLVATVRGSAMPPPQGPGSPPPRGGGRAPAAARPPSGAASAPVVPRPSAPPAPRPPMPTPSTAGAWSDSREGREDRADRDVDEAPAPGRSSFSRTGSSLSRSGSSPSRSGSSFARGGAKIPSRKIQSRPLRGSSAKSSPSSPKKGRAHIERYEGNRDLTSSWRPLPMPDEPGPSEELHDELHVAYEDPRPRDFTPSEHAYDAPAEALPAAKRDAAAALSDAAAVPPEPRPRTARKSRAKVQVSAPAVTGAPAMSSPVAAPAPATPPRRTRTKSRTTATAGSPPPSASASPSSTAASPMAAPPTSAARASAPRVTASTNGAAHACPRCGEGTLRDGARGWGCSRWREGCGFIIRYELGGERLDEAQLRELLARGAVRLTDARAVLDAHAHAAVRLEPF